VCSSDLNSLALIHFYGDSGIGNANNHYVINCESDTWHFTPANWYGATGKVYRQYEFDLTVTDREGNPLQGATVTLTDKNGTAVFTATTDANGAIQTQTGTKGYYDQAHGDTLQENSPHTLNVTRAGYLRYVKKFRLTQKTRWEIKLYRVPPVLLDFGLPALPLFPSES
jgi:hypothetical protein